jgi:hypothetical protein
MTFDEFLRGAQGAASSAAQTVGAGAQELGRNVQAWANQPETRDFLNKAFWFPFEPPT